MIPNFACPPASSLWNPSCAALLKEHVSRGHVEISVSGERARDPRNWQIDRKLLAAYVKAYQMFRSRNSVGAAEPDVMELLRVPGLVVAGNGDCRRKSSDASPVVERYAWPKRWGS